MSHQRKMGAHSRAKYTFSCDGPWAGYQWGLMTCWGGRQMGPRKVAGTKLHLRCYEAIRLLSIILRSQTMYFTIVVRISYPAVSYIIVLVIIWMFSFLFMQMVWICFLRNSQSGAVLLSWAFAGNLREFSQILYFLISLKTIDCLLKRGLVTNILFSG